jgi:hypothetical protein
MTRQEKTLKALRSYRVKAEDITLAVLADETAHFQPKSSSFAARGRADLLSGLNSDGGVKSVDTSPRVGYKRRL